MTPPLSLYDFLATHPTPEQLLWLIDAHALTPTWLAEHHDEQAWLSWMAEEARLQEKRLQDALNTETTYVSVNEDRRLPPGFEEREEILDRIMAHLVNLPGLSWHQLESRAVHMLQLGGMKTYLALREQGQAALLNGLASYPFHPDHFGMENQQIYAVTGFTKPTASYYVASCFKAPSDGLSFLQWTAHRHRCAWRSTWLQDLRREVGWESVQASHEQAFPHVPERHGSHLWSSLRLATRNTAWLKALEEADVPAMVVDNAETNLHQTYADLLTVGNMACFESRLVLRKSVSDHFKRFTVVQKATGDDKQKLLEQFLGFVFTSGKKSQKDIQERWSQLLKQLDESPHSPWMAQHFWAPSLEKLYALPVRNEYGSWHREYAHLRWFENGYKKDVIRSVSELFQTDMTDAFGLDFWAKRYHERHGHSFVIEQEPLLSRVDDGRPSTLFPSDSDYFLTTKGLLHQRLWRMHLETIAKASHEPSSTSFTSALDEADTFASSILEAAYPDLKDSHKVNPDKFSDNHLLQHPVSYDIRRLIFGNNTLNKTLSASMPVLKNLLASSVMPLRLLAFTQAIYGHINQAPSDTKSTLKELLQYVSSSDAPAMLSMMPLIERKRIKFPNDRGERFILDFCIQELSNKIASSLEQSWNQDRSDAQPERPAPRTRF